MNPSDLKTGSDARGQGFLELWDVLRRLRGPGGCPWDREQTLATLTPYITEEAYEILDAVADDKPDDIAEELGDTLFLLVFCADVLTEKSPHTLDSLCRATAEKLKRRHPHVFGDRTITTSGASLRQWQEIKQEEQQSKSLLGKSPASLPSLTAAFRTQEKAASVGFDWPRVEDVVAKIEEELAEVKSELEAREGDGPGHRRLAAEIGDLLFAVANLARFVRVDPERELRATVSRFRTRFQHIEDSLRDQGSHPTKATLEEMDALWEEAKAREEEKS
ncbi:MAG: nucleoside triphosphate pyrophosphohydrolase [Candidatus Eiseniibacteriota bacterium]